MADGDLHVDMDYTIMTVNSQIMYKPYNQRDDPEPDNDHEVYVGNLPVHYTIEKFVNFAKKSGSIYSVRLLKGGGGLNKGFGYIMYRNLAAVEVAIEMFNGSFLAESNSNKALIVQKSLRNTIMMIYGLSPKNNNKYFIKSGIDYFIVNHPSLLLKYECEDDTKLFLSFKSLKAAQIFKNKLKDSFNVYGAKMYYFNDTENWEKWEDLKKNISINPQGNRVRFVPIAPNNANRLNTLPSNSSRSLLFKPFIPKNIANYSSKENNKLTQVKNDQENKNIMPITHLETSLHSIKIDTKSPKLISQQFFQKHHEPKSLNTSTSFIEKCNMNALENSLPKYPLRTIWTNDNSSKDFGCTLPLQNNAFKKQISSTLNCSSQTMQNTNYVLKSKIKNEIQDPSNLTNVSQYLQSSISLSKFTDHKLHPIPENMSTSFFTSDVDKLSSAINQNVRTLESNSLNFINHPFNMDDIWKNYHCQSPRM